MLQTQTIDITHVKTILNSCPNYDKIVNYEYPIGDNLSKKLIDWYRELIFSANGNSSEQLTLISMLDKSLYLYIIDNKYKRDIRKIISVDDLTFNNKENVKNVIKKLIKFTENYESKEIRNFHIAKWL